MWLYLYHPTLKNIQTFAFDYLLFILVLLLLLIWWEREIQLQYTWFCRKIMVTVKFTLCYPKNQWTKQYSFWCIIFHAYSILIFFWQSWRCRYIQHPSWSKLCNHFTLQNIVGKKYFFTSHLRVQNEQFSEEKGFLVRDTEKEV